ncbi:MAG: PAS domain-containing protein [Desulfuromonas sp.]|nr:PAS domain-containing protein [Desulfuromonas sp.]
MKNTRAGVCPFMKAPMADCYCRSLSSENIEKAFDFCSGDYEACTIYQNVFRADEVIDKQLSKEESFPVIGLATGQERHYQLLSRQELSLQVLGLLESNPPARNMFHDFILMLCNFCAVNDITLYILDGDNHLCQEMVGCHGSEVTEARIPGKLDCLCGHIFNGEVLDETLQGTSTGIYWTNDRTTLSPKVAAGLNACINTCCPEQTVGSLVLLPVNYQGKVVGVVRINDPRNNLFTGDDIRFLDGLCSALGVIVGCARSERGCAYAEMIIDSVQSPIAVIDPNYVYRKINHEYGRCVARPESEIIEKTVEEVIGKDLFTKTFKPLIDQALCGERVKDRALVDLSGHPQSSCDICCAPHFSAEGEVDAVVIDIHLVS